MNKIKTWAIIGGGNGGQALAGHLGIMGQKARVFDVYKPTIDILDKKREITLSDAINGTGKIEFATTDIGKAISGADIIVITLPSIYHESITKQIVPCLEDGQTVFIHPEATCGAIAFRKIMKDMGCTKKVVVGAACNLIYATRAIEPGRVHVFGYKNIVNIAALPASDNPKLEEAICTVFDRFKIVDNVLMTSIDNLNAMMHPAPTLLSTSKIESDPYVPFEFYKGMLTPSVGRVVEKLDEERRAIAAEFGFRQRSVRETYVETYPCGTVDDSVDVLVKNNHSYDGIMGPDTVYVRYLLEDIPYSLQPLSALGHVVGVPTPNIDAVITLARTMLGDRITTGRTAEMLGLEGITKKQLLEYVIGS